MRYGVKVSKPFSRFCILGCAIVLSACGAGRPMDLLPTVDKIMLTSGNQQRSADRKVSVEEMLRQVRTKASGEAVPAPAPTVVLTLQSEEIDGEALQALGGFLKGLKSTPHRTIDLQRTKAPAMQALSAARTALRIGNILEQAGFAVRLSIDPDMRPGQFRLIGVAEMRS